MKHAYDEILATALKRRHEPQRFAGDLLKAEIPEKQARSIKYQLTIVKLPLAKDVDGFVFQDTSINESLVRDLAGHPETADGGAGDRRQHIEQQAWPCSASRPSTETIQAGSPVQRR